MKNLSLILVLILAISPIEAAKPNQNFYDIREFAAAGDGETLNTQAIQRAIDACAEAGGGTVYFPPGTYKAGSLHLKSNVTLYLEANATLLQSKDMKHYIRPEDRSYVHHTGSQYVFLHAQNVKNVSIKGKGTIDGNKALGTAQGRPSRGPLPILFENSENILLEDVTVINSPGWSITFSGCKHIDVIRVKCLNSYADGINPVCSQDVLYDGVLIDHSGDDPIAIKNDSTGYVYKTKPDCGYLSKDIVITNTTITNTSHSAIKFGTGTYGVFRNVVISNCTFENTGSIFTIQLMRPKYEQTPQRTIENITFSNITARNVRCLFDITSIDVSIPIIRNISMENIIVDGFRDKSVIHGLPGAPICDLTLNDLKVTYSGAPLDLWLRTRHVQGLKLNNVQIQFAGQVKSALICENTRDLELDSVNIKGITGTEPAIKLDQVKSVFIHNSQLPAVETFLYAQGDETENITFLANDLRKAKKPFDAAPEVPDGSVFPTTDNVEYSNLSVSEEIKANQRFKVNVDLKNAASAGAFKAHVYVDGKVSGSKWFWLKRGKTVAANLTTNRYYKPQSHQIKVGPLVASANVKSSPAAFEYGEMMQINSPAQAGELTTVTVPVKNIGGHKGTKEAELYADGQVIASKKVALDPGEEKQLTIEHRFKEDGPHKLRIGDFPVWPFATFANTKAQYYQTRDKIIIIAGGGRNTLWRGKPEYAAAYLKDVKGDFTATVKMLSQTPTGPYADVGLIVRNDITQPKDSPGFVLLCIEPKYGAQLEWRADLNGDGLLDSNAYGWGGYPMWFKIEKRGNTFTGFTGPDGKQWHKVNKVFEVPSADTAQDVAIFANAYSAKNELSRVELQYFKLQKPTSGEAVK